MKIILSLSIVSVLLLTACNQPETVPTQNTPTVTHTSTSIQGKLETNTGGINTIQTTSSQSASGSL